MKFKRRFTTFSLSFLDIMSCGFGAAVLLFLIIKHDVDARMDVEADTQDAEAALLEEDIRVGERDLVRLRNEIAAVDERLTVVRGAVTKTTQAIDAARQALAARSAASEPATIARLQTELRELEAARARLEAERNRDATHVRRFVGEGDRQYLTGLKVGGRRILILVDRSASMLDHSIVNVIRRRNMAESVKRAADKWQRAVATVDWLTVQFPPSSRYQIYAFNTAAISTVTGTEGRWLEVGDRRQLEQAVAGLRRLVPQGGTSLEAAFRDIRRLEPEPDNIFLITDGLPTQGLQAPHSATVSGRERLALFRRAVDALPAGVPVNVILAPMEGDAMAAPAFWELAQTSAGAFVSPSRDWP